MKKYGILNSNIAKLADDLGHMDLVCIGDLGLPVPNGVDKIDLALRKGSPSFLEVLKEYFKELSFVFSFVCFGLFWFGLVWFF